LAIQKEEEMQKMKESTAKMQLEFSIMKNELDRIHLTYSKQAMDYEEKIRQYERGR